MTIANRIARRLLQWGTATAILLSAAAAQAQTVIYYHTDALGSVVAVTDASRNVIEENEYEPYGKVINHALQDGPGYTGHVADAQTGLIYMQQRYYDDDLGEFPTVDPVSVSSVGGNFNRYWYANNNPYKFIDPDGRRPRRGEMDLCDTPGLCGTSNAQDIAAANGVQVEQASSRVTGGATVGVRQGQQSSPGQGETNFTRIWKLNRPSIRGGYIIQRVDVRIVVKSTVDSRNESARYWEAWEILPGREKPIIGADCFCSDPWPNGTHGSITWKGSAVFFEGLVLPSTFAPGNVKYAPNQNATFSDPGLQGFDAPDALIGNWSVSW